MPFEGQEFEQFQTSPVEKSLEVKERKGKEPQISRSEEVPEETVSKKEGEGASSEASKDKGVSAEEEVRVLGEELELKRRLEIGMERELTLEEKAKRAKDFIETEEFPLSKKSKELFLELSELNLNELEKILGKEGLNLTYEVVLECEILHKNLAENNLTLEDIEKFANQKGFDMLPVSIRNILSRLDYSAFSFENLLRYCKIEILEGESQELSENKASYIQYFKESLQNLKIENDKWRKYSEFEEKAGNLIEIEGFEKLDSYPISGRKLIEKAAEILPSGIFSTIIEKIRYSDEIKQSEKKIGINAQAIASLLVYETDGKKWAEIVFHRIPESEKDAREYLDFIPFALAHEYFHSRDPRFIEQPDLNPAEELQMIKDFEEVRAEEEEWSEYVNKINNPREEWEELFKSQESWADSFALFLHNPCNLKEHRPKRYEFCLSYFKKYFPEFVVDSEKRNRKKEEYEYLIKNYLKSKKYLKNKYG